MYRQIKIEEDIHHLLKVMATDRQVTLIRLAGDIITDYILEMESYQQYHIYNYPTEERDIRNRDRIKQLLNDRQKREESYGK